ncbi:MAG: hydrogenase maturation protease [Gemmatimonadales bacterium]|jgi:hydrogenase maturation protease
MKSTLVLGLGSPLSGDDGIGCYVAGRLAKDPRATRYADILDGGTDVLRQADRMVGRERVILVDAILGDAPPGTVTVVEAGDQRIDRHREHAHHLSACEAVRMLRTIVPTLTATRFKFVLISIPSVRQASALSPELARELPRIVERVRRELCGPDERTVAFSPG